MLTRFLRRDRGTRFTSMLTPETELRPSSHVLATSGEGRTVLLDTRGSRYWGLDDVAGEIWSQVEAGRRIPQIVDALEARFDAPRAQLETDTTQFLGSLLAARLVEVS